MLVKMYTKIQTKEGKELLFTTQQYEVGLYIIINNDPSKQFTIDTKERDFHIELRRDSRKNKSIILEGSIL